MGAKSLSESFVLNEIDYSEMLKILKQVFGNETPQSQVNEWYKLSSKAEGF